MSNLKEYVTILGTIANHTPSNLANLATLIAMDYNKLTDALNFLCIQGCLAQAASEVKTTSNYSITERGLRILEFFKQTHLST